MDGIVTFGVPLAAGLGMLVAAVCIAVLPKFTAVKWLRYMVIPLILFGTGGILAASVAGVSIAGTVRTATTALNSGVANLIPGVGAALMILAALVAVVVLVHDVWDGQIGKRGIVAAVLVPVTLGFIPGGLGGFLETMFGLPAQGFSTVFSAAFGLG